MMRLKWLNFHGGACLVIRLGAFYHLRFLFGFPLKIGAEGILTSTIVF